MTVCDLVTFLNSKIMEYHFMGNRHRLSNANFEADIGFSVCWKIKTLIRSDLKKIVQCKASDAQKNTDPYKFFKIKKLTIYGCCYFGRVPSFA